MQSELLVNQSVDAACGPIKLLLRPEEAAQSLGLSRARLYELMAEGSIRSLKIGRARRVPIAEIKNWIDSELAEQSV